MAYVLLAIAIIFEVISTTLLAMSDGFSKLLPGILSLAFYGVCFVAFSKALQQIDLGIAYATWSSIGMVLTSVIAALLFGERLNLVGIISIAVIMAGCVVLNLYGSAR